MALKLLVNICPHQVLMKSMLLLYSNSHFPSWVRRVILELEIRKIWSVKDAL